MASEPTIEIEPFLKPIDGDIPSGPDLREISDADYSAIKTARRKIVSLAKTAVIDSSVEPELQDQWKIIRKQAPAILKKKSKDLEVAAWFAECLLKLNGFPGLRDGFEIIKQLIENFWDTIYPVPDEDGIETRVYPLISLNGEEGGGTLVRPLTNAPMFPDSEILLSFNSYNRIQDAMKIEDPAERDAKLTEMGVNEQTIKMQVNATTPDAARDFIEDLEKTIDLWNEIGDLIDKKCEEAGESLRLPITDVRNSLREVLEQYQHIMADKLAPAEEAAAEGGGEAAAPGAGGPAVAAGGGQMVARGPMQSRDDAVRQLLAVANYFRAIEPHSPVSGMIERAAHYARMPLSRLLAELIPDANARMHYSLMTGIEIGEEAGPSGPITPIASPSPATTPTAPEPAPEQGSDWSF